ncbi:MAG: aminopeptidase N C-terminal domain-containing protein, partial [Halioglobus sp.]|nr:aminopeptidase N C-terminal domain-containing protein [Halioglobus sp.]
VEAGLAGGPETMPDSRLLEAAADLLRDESLDYAMVADMLMLPSENYLAQLAARDGGADVDTIHAARDIVRAAVGQANEALFLATYERLASNAPYAPDAQQIAARALRNVCLSYLVAADDRYLELAETQFHDATNMTDRYAGLRELAFYGDTARQNAALDKFYADWRHEALVVNQWLQVQAAIPDASALERVQGLLRHEEFDMRNPNKVRAVVGVFAGQNPVNFHRADGEGYRFLGDIVTQLNGSNPQIAARLLGPLTKWRSYRGRAELMQAELKRLAALPDLSPDVFEVVSKSLVQNS